MLETESRREGKDCWLLDALLTKYFSRPSSLPCQRLDCVFAGLFFCSILTRALFWNGIMMIKKLICNFFLPISSQFSFCLSECRLDSTERKFLARSFRFWWFGLWRFYSFTWLYCEYLTSTSKSIPASCSWVVALESLLMSCKYCWKSTRRSSLGPLIPLQIKILALYDVSIYFIHFLSFPWHFIPK